MQLERCGHANSEGDINHGFFTLGLEKIVLDNKDERLHSLKCGVVKLLGERLARCGNEALTSLVRSRRGNCWVSGVARCETTERKQQCLVDSAFFDAWHKSWFVEKVVSLAMDVPKVKFSEMNDDFHWRQLA